MKPLQNRSLSAILSAIVNLIWWLEWLGGAYCIIMGTMAACIRKAYVFIIPINYDPITIRQIYTIQKNGPVGILNSTNGNLAFGIRANLQNIVMLLVAFCVLFGAILIITYQLKKILHSLKQHEPFQQKNIVRLKTIAFVLIGYSLLQWVFVIVVTQILVSPFRFPHMDLTYGFNYNCVLMGVILLVVQEIFKSGMLLEEDKQLTI
jgi:hypothetical protein